MEEFEGLKPQDFDDLAGSTWRSRKRLGGMLAQALKQQLGCAYQSWGVRRRLELHLAHQEDYDFFNPWPYAKLFVYTQCDLVFGFYIESDRASSDNIGQYQHWRSFRDRIQQDPAMQAALLSAMANHGLTMTDYYRRKSCGALGCEFQFQDNQLHWRRPDDPSWRPIGVKDMFRRLGRLPEEQWVDLHVFACLKKQAAIDLGSTVVHEILPVLRALAPVYEMTVAG